jgi:3-oxoadipate enol-lactonase
VSERTRRAASRGALSLVPFLWASKEMNKKHTLKLEVITNCYLCLFTVVSKIKYDSFEIKKEDFKMPFFKKDNAQIYFEDTGSGEPIIAVHGLIENTMYWKHVADVLSKRYMFISMDMRAHGRTVVQGEPYGFDADTIGSDIIALADHLNISRFHLLTHSTGGFAAVRYAMKDASRIATLVLTNTGSFTSPVPGDPETIRQFHHNFSKLFDNYEWEQIVAGIRANPRPFFRGIMESDSPEPMMKFAYDMMKIGDRGAIAAFVRTFYTDPDPRIEDLRNMKCPVLVIYGEKDDLFIESSRLMAKEIPGAQLIEYKGIGHMTAIEAPELLCRDIKIFLEQHTV